MNRTGEASKAITKTRLVMNIFFGLLWFLFTYNFALQVVHAPGVIQSVLQLATEGVMVILAILTLRKAIDWVVIISFLVLAGYTNSLNHESWLVFGNGLRTYLPMLLIPPVIRFMLSTRERATEFVKRMDKSLFIFLLIQLPCMFVQLRTAPDGNPDYVGGSLGSFMSGVVSMLIYLVSFYLMRRKWNSKRSYLGNLKDNWVLLALLLPTFLNETKISFIFLLIYFILLVSFDRRFIKNVLIMIPIVMVVLIGGIQIYLRSAGASEEVFTIDYLNEYFSSDVMVELVEQDKLEDADDWIASSMTTNVDFPRGIKFMMVPVMLNEHRHGGWIFGYGIGQYKGGTLIGQSEFAKRYSYLTTGTVISGIVIIVELGIMGIAWLIFYILVLLGVFRSWKVINRNLRCYVALTVIIILAYGPDLFMISAMCVIVYTAMMSVRWRLTEMLPEPDTSFHRVLTLLHLPHHSKSIKSHEP